MSQMNAKEQLTIVLAQRGILGDKLEPEISKIYASIPAATRSAYPDDMYEAVLKFVDVYYGGQSAPSVAPTSVQPVGEAAPATINTAQAKAIQQVMSKNKAAKEERTSKTVIEKLLIDKPAPSSYLDESMTIIPICKPEKLAEYEAKLDREDPENVAAFEKLSQAVKNNTPMAIYINSPQYKVKGFKILTPSMEAGKDALEPKTLTNDAMLGFVTTALDGYIPTKGDGLGVKLRWNNPRRGKKANSKRALGAPTLVIGNKKEAISNTNSHEVISKIEMNGNEKVTKAGKLRTALSFRIETGEVKTNNEKIYRTIRFTGDAQVPKFIRTTDEYNKLFGMSEKDRSTITPPTPAEAAELEEAMTNTIAYMMQNGASKFDIGAFQDAMAATSVGVGATQGVEL